MLFSCKGLDRTWNLARVTLFKTISHPEESGIGMRRVREDTLGTYIDVSWIVRSVFLSQVYDYDDRETGDFFVNDLLDWDSDSADVYLRLRALSNNNSLCF